MTLATKITIVGPVPVTPLYEMLDRMVSPRTPYTPSMARIEGGTIHNYPGQNRSALDIHFYETPEDERDSPEVREWAEDHFGDLPHWIAPKPYHVKIRLDTCYGYHEEGIGNENDLHAAIIMATVVWAADFGARVIWQDEYSGKWHEGFDSLDDLAISGAKALAWFQNAAIPALREMGVEPT